MLALLLLNIKRCHAGVCGVIGLYQKDPKDAEPRTSIGPKTGKGDIMKTINAEELHAKDMAEDSAYRLAYDGLAGEFELVNALLQARARAGISQAEVASRMGTTESTVSRLESGRTKPSTRTLERYAEATGHRLHIRLEPTGV